MSSRPLLQARELPDSVQGDEVWSGVSFAEISTAPNLAICFHVAEVGITLRFPNIFSGLSVERDEILHVNPVHSEDNEVFVENDG